MLNLLKTTLILGLIFTTSCGNNDSEIHKKIYTLNASQTTPQIQAKIKELIADFNAGVGYTVLTYVEDASKANSPITVTSGLLSEDRDHDGEDDNKVGWGNWYTEKSSERSLSLRGTSEKVTIEYGMELEFDQEYIEYRLKLNNKQANTDLKKLFHHEVGHGLKLGHNDEDPSDLMYPNIAGTKDFEAFFQQVRDFFERA